jgi:hypothetical protein
MATTAPSPAGPSSTRTGVPDACCAPGGGQPPSSVSSSCAPRLCCVATYVTVLIGILISTEQFAAMQDAVAPDGPVAQRLHAALLARFAPFVAATSGSVHGRELLDETATSAGTSPAPRDSARYRYSSRSATTVSTVANSTWPP